MTTNGTRHTSIEVKFADEETGVALKNIKCTISNEMENIVKYSTKKGFMRIYSLPEGNWLVTCEHEIYITQVLHNIGVDEIHVARFKVILKKKSAGQ